MCHLFLKPRAVFIDRVESLAKLNDFSQMFNSNAVFKIFYVPLINVYKIYFLLKTKLIYNLFEKCYLRTPLQLKFKFFASTETQTSASSSPIR